MWGPIITDDGCVPGEGDFWAGTLNIGDMEISDTPGYPISAGGWSASRELSTEDFNCPHLLWPSPWMEKHSRHLAWKARIQKDEGRSERNIVHGYGSIILLSPGIKTICGFRGFVLLPCEFLLRDALKWHFIRQGLKSVCISFLTQAKYIFHIYFLQDHFTVPVTVLSSFCKSIHWNIVWNAKVASF